RTSHEWAAGLIVPRLVQVEARHNLSGAPSLIDTGIQGDVGNVPAGVVPRIAGRTGSGDPEERAEVCRAGGHRKAGVEAGGRTGRSLVEVTDVLRERSVVFQRAADREAVAEI